MIEDRFETLEEPFEDAFDGAECPDGIVLACAVFFNCGGWSSDPYKPVSLRNFNNLFPIRPREQTLGYLICGPVFKLPYAAIFLALLQSLCAMSLSREGNSFGIESDLHALSTKRTNVQTNPWQGWMGDGQYFP
mmetsp:Transcript_11057/g.21607  ORF Transcript_11057/g.21607 Transcript_11057/m.21607 type:complete len:134 (-) Transcript_11057:237-638(-)